MKVRVIAYSEKQDYWLCNDEEGNRFNLDLLTDATFPEYQNNYPDNHLSNLELCKSLVGKKLQIESTFPWISFARNVKIIK